MHWREPLIWLTCCISLCFATGRGDNPTQAGSHNLEPGWETQYKRVAQLFYPDPQGCHDKLQTSEDWLEDIGDMLFAGLLTTARAKFSGVPDWEAPFATGYLKTFFKAEPRSPETDFVYRNLEAAFQLIRTGVQKSGYRKPVLFCDGAPFTDEKRFAEPEERILNPWYSKNPNKNAGTGAGSQEPKVPDEYFGGKSPDAAVLDQLLRDDPEYITVSQMIQADMEITEDKVKDYVAIKFDFPKAKGWYIAHKGTINSIRNADKGKGKYAFVQERLSRAPGSDAGFMFLSPNLFKDNRRLKDLSPSPGDKQTLNNVMPGSMTMLHELMHYATASPIPHNTLEDKTLEKEGDSYNLAIITSPDYSSGYSLKNAESYAFYCLGSFITTGFEVPNAQYGYAKQRVTYADDGGYCKFLTKKELGKHWGEFPSSEITNARSGRRMRRKSIE